jgi:hypothetical protein
MALFEGYERRIAQIDSYLAASGIESLEKAEEICLNKNVDVRKIVKSIQNISFENAGWAYLIGAAVAIKKNQTVAAEVAETLGAGLQAFCIPGSVADDRKVGIGHGNLPPTTRARLLCAWFSTAWARMRLRLSRASTGSPMCRPSSTTRPAS